MKKLALTIAILLGMGMTTFAQTDYDNEGSRGLFGFGLSFFDNDEDFALFPEISEYDREMEDYYVEPSYGGENGLFGLGKGFFNNRAGEGTLDLTLPGSHGMDNDQDTPLGSGIAVLMGLGAAYLVAKRRKED